jgi:23S rRNA pseudouridine2605 synthase
VNPKRPRFPRKPDHAPGRSKPESKPTLKTLDRVLSKAGIASRTEACEWIQAGRIAVNGQIVRDPEHWVNLNRDRIRLDGKPVRPEKKLCLLLYKPKGYLTTYNDPDGRPTVYDLLKEVKQWVFPVGRLDQETSGLLLVTNDADLAEHITNPEHKVPKTYLVKTATVLSPEQMDRLRHGVQLKDGMTRPAQVRHVRDSASKTFLEITISEGRNRQIRRMVEAVESHVLKLVRTAIGPVRIGNLQIGQYRTLSADEVQVLRNAGR